MALKVVNDNILIEKLEQQGDIYIETDLCQGKVIEVGPGRVTPLGIVAVVQVAPGDVITFNINRAVEIPFEKDTYVVQQNDVIAYEPKTEEEEV